MQEIIFPLEKFKQICNSKTSKEAAAEIGWSRTVILREAKKLGIKFKRSQRRGRKSHCVK